MPSTAPLMSTPSGTPCGTGTPRTSDVVRRPNATSTAATTPTDQATTSNGRRAQGGSVTRGRSTPRSLGRPGRFMTGRSHAGREHRLPARDVSELVALAALQRDIGTVGAVGRRRRVGVPVDL